MAGTAKRPRALTASPELDANLEYVKRSKKTGRPTRSAAGRRSFPSGFVHPDDVDLDDDSAPEDDSHDEGKKTEGKRKPWSTRRRRTSPPRALPPAAPISDLTAESSLDTRPLTPSLSSSSQELSLTFHVQPGHTGPFVVKIDLASILQGSPIVPTAASAPSINTISTSSNCFASASPGVLSRAATPDRVGFLSLPAELRNHIYRLVFGPRKAINLCLVNNFCRSSAFLATCRQVHDEGVQILYGENKFELQRQWRPRAAYYEKTWSEVGFKDCFRFLATIGPVNISHLRTLTIIFEDGPSSSAYSTSSGPFVDDDSLMECLKLLAGYGRLKKLKLAIHGKRQVKQTDFRFLDNLQAIKADIVKMVARPKYKRYGGYHCSKKANVFGDIDIKLVERMQRKKKLY